MRTSSTYDPSGELRLLSMATSAAGMLCLSLSGLLHWGVFSILAVVHLIIWRRFFDREIIGTWTALGVIAASGVFEMWRISLSGPDAVIPALRDFIIILAMTRVLMRKTPREIYQIVGISVTQCMLGTIFTISPLFLIGLALMVVLVPMTLYHLDAHSFSTASLHRKRYLAHWAKVSLGIVLCTGILFYILPRPASSIIRHSFVRQSRFSFDEDVDLTERGRVSNDSAIVMRIIWSSGAAPRVIYLSGARLEGISPDGFFRQETRGSVAPVSNMVTDRLTVYPSGISSENVFYPYWFHDISPRLCLFRGSNLYWLGEPPPRYDLWVSRATGPSVPGSTDVPRELSLVAEFGIRTAGQGDAKTRVDRLVRHLRTNYVYSLDQQQTPPGRYGIEWFVLSGRKGTCEHFASALAAMIRGCGIPARVVTGFLVSEYNETGNYYIARAADAHAWVEYWDGSWHVADATPTGRSAPVLRFHLLDEIRFSWLRWVIEYSLDDQIHIAVRVFSSAPRVTNRIELTASYALALIGALVALLAAATFVKNSLLSPYEKVRRAFERTGTRLPATSSHEEHLAIVRGTDPALAETFRLYLRDYLAWRFGRGYSDIGEQTRNMLRQIRKSGRR